LRGAGGLHHFCITTMGSIQENNDEKNKIQISTELKSWICKAKREKAIEEKPVEEREEKPKFHIGNM